MVTRKSITVKNTPYNYDRISFSSFQHSDASHRDPRPSKYYFSQEYFIKETTDSYISGTQKFYKNYGEKVKDLHIPKLIDFQEFKNKRVICVFERIKNGENVANNLSKYSTQSKKTIFLQTVEILSELEMRGIQIDLIDVRSWNLLFDGKKTYLIDFDTYTPIPNSNTKMALLYLLYSLDRNKVPLIHMEKIIGLLKKTSSFGVFSNIAKYIQENLYNDEITMKEIYEFTKNNL